MIDPVQAFEIATSTLLVPTHLPTSTVSPIPTVIPNVPIYETVGESGTKALWVVFVVLLLSTVVISILAFRAPVQKRIFHVLSAFITAFATISYFAMATGDGNSYTHILVRHIHKHTPDTVEHVFRQIFWARSVDWALTGPLIILNLAFLAGLSGANIIVAVVADISTVLLGLFASFGSSGGQKWGYYAFALIAYLIVIHQLAIPGRRAVKSRESATGKLFASLAIFTLIVWTIYPIVWAIGDGVRIWSVDSEIIAYAILDILAKPVFAFWLLIAHSKSSALAVEGFWTHGLDTEGAIRIDDESA